MVIVLVLLVSLVGLPAVLGLIALAAALVRPKQWEIIATIVSGPPILAFFVAMAISLASPDETGDAGPITAVRMIILTPFLVWYLSVICGGAYAGYWLAGRLRRRMQG